MFDSNVMKSCILISFLVVVLGVFIGLSMCTLMHPPKETFVSSSCSVKPVKKCIRVVSSSPVNETVNRATADSDSVVSSNVIMVTDGSSVNSSADTSPTCPSKPKKKESSSSNGCPKPVYCPPCPKCPQPCPRMCPDMSKYVLKTSIPPCPEPKVDMDVYMLKSKCKKTDLSKYVLKSSLPSYKTPPCPPCICKCGGDDKTSTPDAETSSVPTDSSNAPDTESANTSNTNALLNLFEFGNTTNDDGNQTPTSTSSPNNTTSNKTVGNRGDGIESVNTDSTADTNSSRMFNSRNDMFGTSGILGDANMSAWNDDNFGASIGASSNLTGSCSTFQNTTK